MTTRPRRLGGSLHLDQASKLCDTPQARINLSRHGVPVTLQQLLDMVVEAKVEKKFEEESITSLIAELFSVGITTIDSFRTRCAAFNGEDEEAEAAHPLQLTSCSRPLLQQPPLQQAPLQQAPDPAAPPFSPAALSSLTGGLGVSKVKK